MALVEEDVRVTGATERMESIALEHCLGDLICYYGYYMGRVLIDGVECIYNSFI